MRCATCGGDAKGRIVYEMWHGLDRPGLGGFLALAGPWACGAHDPGYPGPEQARHFAARFMAENLPTPPRETKLRVGAGFVALTEGEGRELERDPEMLYRRQLTGTITIEAASPEEWKRLQRDVERRNALIRAAKTGAPLRQR